MSTKVRIVVSSSELLKRSFLCKVRKYFTTTNVPQTKFLLKGAILRELCQLMHFLIEEANLSSVLAEEKMRKTAAEISAIPFSGYRARSSKGFLMTERQFKKIANFYREHSVQEKATEYVPPEMKRFLDYFLLRLSWTRFRGIFTPTPREERIYEYILSSENQVDKFVYNKGLNQTLTLKYEYESLGSRSNISHRQSSVSTVSYAGRRGSYESFDNGFPSFICVVGAGLWSRQSLNDDPFASSHDRIEKNAFYNEVMMCKRLYLERPSKVTVIYSAFQFLETIKRHPFPNFGKQSFFGDFKGEPLIPGTHRMKQVQETKAKDMWELEDLTEIRNYFYEFFVTPGNHASDAIRRRDIIEDYYSELSPNVILRIFSAK